MDPFIVSQWTKLETFANRNDQKALLLGKMSDSYLVLLPSPAL